MTDINDEILRAQKIAAQALSNKGENRREHLLQAADVLRKVMERQSLQVRDLILSQPPIPLLGYLWAQFHMSVLADLREKGEDYRPDKEIIQTFQFVLEYAHAVWSSHDQIDDEKTRIDEGKVASLFEALEQLKNTTMFYCLASSAARIEPDGDRQSADTEFHAKSTWVLNRGHRYQVLEEEFFTFVLGPHADALRDTYGMTFDAIAAGIQAITNSIRTGFSIAAEQMQEGMEQAHAIMEKSGAGLRNAIEKIKEADSDFAAKMSGAMHDIFYGGICNLSRHTNFTTPLLEDICYSPGDNSEFFADGEFKGTPMRTLPSLIKPGIKLGDEYYVTDAQFVRDSTYRAIQRGLLSRLPQYREEWNRRQKVLIEQSFPAIFKHQLREAATYSEIFFKNSKTGQWVESDLVMTVDDILVVIEAKAGVMAMHSPAINFERHERAIRELIIKAYEQCKRFTEYLASASEVSIYNMINGNYVEIGRLRQQDFRVILPIGLTVEAFTPFSAMSKDLAKIEPLLGKYPFISMSVDDLFVLNRYLPTTGELFHYLEVRQQAAGIPNAILIDEVDHLGAYISHNRFDVVMKEQLEEADMVILDSPSDPVDKYFEGETWKTEPAPHQEYPGELTSVLNALDRFRPAGWLEMDTYIRNYNSSGRNNMAKIFMELQATLSLHPIRRFLFGSENPLQVWLCRDGIQPTLEEMRYQGEVGCLVMNASKILVLRLSYDEKGEINDLGCTSFTKPYVTQPNYADLKRQAEHQLARAMEFS